MIKNLLIIRYLVNYCRFIKKGKAKIRASLFADNITKNNFANNFFPPTKISRHFIGFSLAIQLKTMGNCNFHRTAGSNNDDTSISTQKFLKNQNVKK